jgi:methylglutaconyl-CoA hydratase
MSHSDAYQTLKVDLDSRGVLTVKLNRPDVRNAFNDVVIEEFFRVCEKEVTKKDVKVVLLKGEGQTFCAGGDLNWIKKAIDLDYAENLKDTRRLAQMFAALNEIPKPVIGAVHGAAIGGGVGLVSICDIVVAEEGTQFSLSEVRLGIVPACIGPFVVSKVGASHARRFFMSAERMTSQQAKEIGLVHEIYKDQGAMNKAVEKLLENILQCGPNAVSAAKRLVLDLSWPERRAQFPNCLEYVATMLADLRISAEGQEGVKAFLEKRKPNWIS